MATRYGTTHPSAVDYLFSIVGRLLVWLTKLLAKLIWRIVVLAVCHPRTSTATAVMATLVLYVGWVRITVTAGCLLVLLSTWKAAHRRSFEATVQAWMRTWWRRWWCYRRRWVKVFTRCELTVVDGDQVLVPKLVSVVTTPYWDRIAIQAPIGHELDQFRDTAERLRGAFGAQRAAVRELGPLRYGLDFMRRDPLAATVAPAPIPASLEDINFRAIPIGLDEYGDAYTLSVLGGHTSAAGTTGAGKAGVEWNLLRGLAPAIVAGWVRPVFIDPKGRELRQARAICAPDDYVGADPDGVLALLERLVGQMDAANERDGSNGERDFEPALDRVLTLICIDELAPLLRYWARSIRSKIEDQLGLLLTQGRAAGFIVVGAVQEPTKDTFTIRDLFQRRLALRLPTESHTDASLIEDAVKYGAMCHQIPDDGQAGVFYSLESGARSTVRARLGYVEDHHIAELVEYVTSRRNVVDLDSRRTAGPDTKAA